MFRVPGSVRRSRFVLAAVAGAGVGLAAQVPPPEKIVPVHEESHHRQLFQHGAVRILDMQIAPGDESAFHRHDWPVLLLGLTTSQTRRQNLGEEWSAEAAAPPASTVRSIRPTSTTTYADKPLTHRLENIGTGIARNFIVVNESAGDDSLTEQQAGFTAKPELANKWFRAYRIALSPGERTAAHKHSAPVVLVQVTDGKAVGAGAMTWEFNTPGQWAFFEPGDPHAFANIGDARIELIEVEVRTRP
jgi:quercetin dioxygenase-like cupin family protein